MILFCIFYHFLGCRKLSKLEYTFEKLENEQEKTLYYVVTLFFDLAGAVVGYISTMFVLANLLHIVGLEGYLDFSKDLLLNPFALGAWAIVAILFFYYRHSKFPFPNEADILHLSILDEGIIIILVSLVSSVICAGWISLSVPGHYIAKLLSSRKIG